MKDLDTTAQQYADEYSDDEKHTVHYLAGFRADLAEAKQEIDELRGEIITYRTLESLMADNGRVCELYDDIDALEAKLSTCVQALEKILPLCWASEDDIKKVVEDALARISKAKEKTE